MKGAWRSRILPGWAAFLIACTTSSMKPDAGAEVAWMAPQPAYREQAPFILPPGSGQLAAIAVQSHDGTLYAAAGTKLYQADAAGSGVLKEVLDLSSFGVSQVSSIYVSPAADLVVFDGSQILRIALPTRTPTGQARSPFTRTAAVAVSADATTVYAVEGGGGSPGKSGQAVVHVAALDLAGKVVTDPWELTPPFTVSPAEVGGINAGAAFVAADGTALYVTHVILRQLYRVSLTAAHAVTIADTESVQRSATTVSLGADGLLVEAAIFDQTVPVFSAVDATHWHYLAELPIGISPQSVASYRGRVMVGIGGGFAGPPPGDGGFPGFPDGGVVAPADAGVGSGASQIRVFILASTSGGIP